MNRNGSAKSGVLFGIILVVLGTILLMERIDILPTNLLRHFWPLLWILLGATLVVGNRGPFGRAFGVLLLIFGISVEANKLGFFRIRFWDLWPVWLISLGIFLLWRALRPPQPSNANRLELLDSYVSEYAIFGGGELRVVTDKFEGGNFTAVFGGNQVDFTSSKIANGTAELYCDAIFGGIELKVPPTWRVTTTGQAVFGGVENKTLTPVAAEGGAEQHLIVHTTAVFGGIEVKN